MAMELDHSFTVPVPPDQAWDVLLDVQRIAPCMPGATVETVDGDDVAGRLKVKVGPVSLTYKGTATFKDRDTTDRSVLVEASGKETRGSGTASATVRAALSPQNGADSDGSSGETLVTLHTTLNVTGRPAQFGRGVIAEVGSRLIDQFADNLARQLGSGSAPAAADSGAGAAGASETAAPAATAEAPAAAAASPAPADTSSSATATAPPSVTAASPEPAASATRSATAESTRPHSVPMRPAAPPAPAQDQDEALNLLSLVGPVLVKRLAPVVGALTGAALLTWAVRRIIRRRKSA